ncbi:endoplasmic reticulum export factor secretory 16 isoform X7 [Augochlora pura]
MSNPYRARPARSKVDHNLGYGAHNQNMWNPISRVQPDISSSDSMQQQTAVMNQSKQTADPWNNLWNWDFDKQANNQQQQQQPPQQDQQPQQHYAPPYKNQGQNIMPDGNMHGTTSNKQPISNHSDSYPSYMNYPYQQYPPPPRPISEKSASLDYDRSQWTNEPQPQTVPYPPQKSSAQSQEDQAGYPFLAGSNYNWHKPGQTNSMPPNNWQNKAATDWQDPEMDTSIKSFDDMGNQCPPSSLQRSRSYPRPPAAPENTKIEHSTNDANSWPNQMNVSAFPWGKPNYESVQPNQGQQTQNSSINDFSSWSQPTSTDPLQQWKHTNESHSSQWLQEQRDNNNLAEENMKPDNAGVVSSNDWQPNRTVPPHYSLPNMPPPVESGIEPEERKKSIPALISKDPAMHAKTNVSKTQLSDSRLNMSSTPETVSTVASSENVSVQENNEFNSVGDLADWGKNVLPDELPTKLEQMSLGPKTSKLLEHQNESSETPISVASGDVWNQSTTSHNSTADQIPVAPSDYPGTVSELPHSIDNQAVVNQEHSAQSGNQAASLAPIDNVVQSGYDQWYKQNTLPRSDCSTTFFKDWIAEQNVENYEIIQQPAEFVNLEVVTPSLQERDIYGSRDSINKETLDNDPKPVVNPVKEAVSTRDFRLEVNNVEVPTAQQPTRSLPPLQPEQVPDNYEFASNDRNTFLETGELTDSHQEHEPTPPSQDDENDEVPNDIPFLREVPGQSSSIDPRRNDPTGQEQYVQSAQRLSDPRRNDPSGQEQGLQLRNIADRSERRDIPPGQERSVSLLSRSDSDTLERRNDPSGRERSLPPQQSRNDPSGEERQQSQPQIMLEPSETREVPGRGNEPEEPNQQTDENLRQIPGGASPNEVIQSLDDRPNGRVVTGSQEVPSASSAISDQVSDSRSKREEAVGASIRDAQGASSSSNRRDSYDENDEGSGNSREDSRERRRDSSSERRRYEYERKNYYDREREYDDDYYYDRRRGAETDRSYNSRDEFDRREMPYREDDRKHPSRDDLDRHAREDLERRNKPKDDLDERDSRRRPDDRRRDRGEDVRRREREIRDYDPRHPRDRDYLDRDRRRDDRRPRRYDDFDVRDPYYDDPYSRGSRPSSRSSYNDRDRAYYMRSREHYYGYNGYPGYDYGVHYASNYYAYIENLRRTNPAAYSEWYHKYYANQHQQQLVSRGVSNYPEDRASVHSGRSSCDDRTTGEKRTLGDTSVLEDSTSASARMTPTKFSTSHAYGYFSIGSLIHVLPSYPTDGERAKVEILKLDNLLSHDPVTRDLRAYPGPLIKQVGVTHKKTIIEYCENKIKKAAANEEMIDRASYILLYELMIILIQQNGNVVGVDIAALLLRNKETYPYELNKKSQDSGRRESVISQRSGLAGDGFQGSQESSAVASEKLEIKPRKSIEQITDEFRNTLLYGLVQEALEYAMTEGLWGHALFLASKLDKRTHASVMTRFANSLPYHDPLQTLYQLHSGRVPAVVTGISDPRWDDWRPHLAMIICNTSNPEINRRSITTLGDTLSARGDIHAAHFCYILSQVDFGAYEASNVKLVLIGANHHKPYKTFLTTEAVMLTEIYEYARNLSEPGFTLVDLQTFKFDLALKMMDHGLIEKALLYIEQIAVNITNEPSKYKKSFICAVYNLGDRIKYHDPVYKDSTDEAVTLAWFDNLAEIVSKCYSGEIVENDTYGSQAKQESYSSMQNQDMYEMKHPQQQLQQQQQAQLWNPPQPDYREGPTSMMEIPSTDAQSEWQPLSLPSNMPDTYDQSIQYSRNNEESYQQPQQQDYWNQDSYYQNNYGRNDSTVNNWQQQSTGGPYPPEQGDTDNSQLQENWNYEAEREDKTATPEVSNYALTADSNIGPDEWSLDGTNISSLRRRKILSDSLAKPQIDSRSSESNIIGSSSSSVSNPYRSSKLEETKSTKPPKMITYPKITATYPKLLPSNKLSSRDVKKIKKIDGRYVKPPSSQPPVFLKCKVKKKSDHDNDNSVPNDPEPLINEDSLTSPAATTDLDVQFTEVSLESISKLDSRVGRGSPRPPDTDSQTLKQYCNFEDKKVMRVAPHIRRKDVICDTVDAWSYSNPAQNSSEFFRYKPLVFGGTYPIDLPVRPVRSDLNLAELTEFPVEKSIIKTYDIDVPTNCE